MKFLEKETTKKKLERMQMITGNCLVILNSTMCQWPTKVSKADVVLLVVALHGKNVHLCGAECTIS